MNCRTCVYIDLHIALAAFFAHHDLVYASHQRLYHMSSHPHEQLHHVPLQYMYVLVVEALLRDVRLRTHRNGGHITLCR